VIWAGEKQASPFSHPSSATPVPVPARHLGRASGVTPQAEFASVNHVSPQLLAKSETTTAFKIPMATAPSPCKLQLHWQP